VTGWKSTSFSLHTSFNDNQSVILSAGENGHPGQLLYPFKA